MDPKPKRRERSRGATLVGLVVDGIVWCLGAIFS